MLQFQYQGKLALLGACLLMAGSAHADVTVNYVQPDKFSDVPRDPDQRQRALDDLAGHFRKLGADLRPGQDLGIEVLDINLAGREVPNRSGGDAIRVMRAGADWPTMTLRYTLSERGRVLSSGDAQLADQNYGTRVNGYSSDTRWRYERQMIDDWWRKTIVPFEQAGRQGN